MMLELVSVVHQKELVLRALCSNEENPNMAWHGQDLHITLETSVGASLMCLQHPLCVLC